MRRASTRRRCWRCASRSPRSSCWRCRSRAGRSGRAVPRWRHSSRMGAIGYAGQAFTFFTALTLAPAGLVALLLYLHPALVALLSALLLHERLSAPKIAALVVALAGMLLTVLPTLGDGARDAHPGILRGVAFGVAAAAIYAGYIVVGAPRRPAGRAAADGHAGHRQRRGACSSAWRWRPARAGPARRQAGSRSRASRSSRRSPRSRCSSPASRASGRRRRRRCRRSSRCSRCCSPRSCSGRRSRRSSSPAAR